MSESEANSFNNLFDEEEFSQCQACGGNLKKDKVNLEEFEGGKLYVMEQVPAYVCQMCGELWVPAPVVKDFEKMLEASKNYKKNKTPILSTPKTPNKNPLKKTKRSAFKPKKDRL